MSESYKNYPICVLAGNYKEYRDYVVSQGAPPSDPRWFYGTGPTCGIHFSRIVTVGTFFQLKNAQDILAYCKAGVWPMSVSEPKFDFDEKYPKIPKEARLMKPGEIRKLPKNSSPMWTEQWAYQGTAKSPYIVSSKRTPGDGQQTGWDFVWACACPDWCKHMPRVDCKHILAVKLKEKITVSAASVGPKMDPTMKKEFENFLAKKNAAVIVSSGLKKSGLEEKGRRFRT